jgi:hypothetical protein
MALAAAAPALGERAGGPAAGSSGGTARRSGEGSKARPAEGTDGAEETKEVIEGYGVWGPRKRFRPDPLPRTADDAPDPYVELAIRAAPGLPASALPYAGRDKALAAARNIRDRVPTFANFRAAIPHASWKVHASYEWHVRRNGQCLADLRAQGLRVKRVEVEEVGAGAEPSALTAGEHQSAGTKLPPTGFEAVPAPVYVHGEVEGVRFSPGRGDPVLVSCELAARLRIIARIVARHGVDQVVIASAHREQPFTSFHTMGLALDISRFHLQEPLPGPRGELSPWLTVLTDFYATPDRETCDAALLGPGRPLGRNERGRVMLRIACELHASGAFASVLTPNYNPGHRDHFHVDIRPDDPRIFLR